jgi:Mg-chelatase subunit ChlD
MDKQIIQGSLRQIAQQNGKSLAETFMSADIICIVDVSGSMNNDDSRGGRTRFSVAAEELASLQNRLPGKVALIAFSSDVQFCPSGIPVQMGGSTGMHKALQFVKVVDDIPGIRFFMISDGEPDSPDETLRVAATFKNHISCVYVGPEDHPTGRDFLQRLAKCTGGQTVTADRARELAASVEKLLLKS